MKKYRNEWKYICNIPDITLLNNRLKSILTLDPYSEKNGKYIVRSLYFDDYKDNCAKDNEAGTANRYKWRIRYYGNSINNIHLEKKEKVYGMCHKDSCSLTLDEYDRIINNDITILFWNTDKKLLKQFCIDIMNKSFRPKVIIDYERTAYIEPITNIRITLDTNISASYEFEKFLNHDYLLYPLQDNEYHVLEVKFDDILPSYIKNIVCSHKYVQTTFSKYYLGRMKLKGVLK